MIKGAKVKWPECLLLDDASDSDPRVEALSHELAAALHRFDEHLSAQFDRFAKLDPEIAAAALRALGAKRTVMQWLAAGRLVLLAAGRRDEVRDEIGRLERRAY